MTQLFAAASGGISGSQWAAIGVVATIILGVCGLYYMANQKAVATHEAERQRTAEAIAPYKEQIVQMRIDHNTAINDLRLQMQAQIDQRDDVITTRNRTVELREARIDVLEDQLRGKRS